MRNAIALIFTLMVAGCTTLTYHSEKPADVVSSCIANGWRKVHGPEVELPVSLTRTDDYYFVDVVLVRDFPTFIPIHSIWAKVRSGSPGNPSGSSTEYRRNLQIKHEKIDQVVVECQ